MIILDLYMLKVQLHNLNKLQSYSLPSNSYISLTLGASGTTYTAPADGWVYLRKAASSTDQYDSLYNRGLNGDEELVGNSARARTDSDAPPIFIPVKKNDVFVCNYTMGGKLRYFIFVYAVGSEPQS